MLTANRVCITLITLILLPFHLAASNLGVSEKYNGFFLETFTATSSRIEGRLATGGTITVEGYSFGDKLVPENAGTVVITGGDLDYRDGRIYFGSAIAAGNIDKVGNGVLHGMAEGKSVLGNQTLPFNFEEQFVHLTDVSSRLSQSPANGTSLYKWGGLYLQGDCESPLQVFNLTGSLVLSAHTFEVTCIPDDATVIFNISGETPGFKTFSLANLIPHRTKTLYNFYEATELTLNGMEVEGSILAPYAHIEDPRGTTNGTVMAKSWNGQMHLHHFPFTGDLGFLSNPPEIISPAVFYTDEKVSYDYDVEAIDPDYNEVLTYSLDKAPQGMAVDAQTGQISWLADDSYTASNAKFNKQCYIVPEGAIEIVQNGDEPKSGRNYIAPLFLGVKEAIKNAGNYVAPAAVAWHEEQDRPDRPCLGCHVETQSLLGLATSQDKADVDKGAIEYLLSVLLDSQQANGAIYRSHPQWSVIQTTLALWSLSDGIEAERTFYARAKALDYLFNQKRGTDKFYWVQEYNTGWMNNYTATTAIVALSASRYLSDAQKQSVSSAQQTTIDNWQSIIPQIAEYFLSSYQTENEISLMNAFRLVGLSELYPHVKDATLRTRIETAQQYLNTKLRNKQLPSGGWSYSLSGTQSDPMISAWVGIALNYLQPALTDSAVLKNITFLLDSQAANGTWYTPSQLFKDSDFGATSLVMSYLPVALEHLGNPDLRVSDVILSEQDELPHRLSATISNRGLGDVTTPIIVEFYNDKEELLGSSNLDDLRSAVNQTVSINVTEETLTKDVFVRLTVGKDVEECLIGNNEVKAAIVKARVTDLYGNFDTQIFSVNVNDVNEAPVITSQADIEHHQGQEYLYQVQVTDTDIGDAAKFVLVAPPAGLYIDERTGQIFSNSDQLLPGEYTITVVVSDLAGLTVEQTFTLTVKENQAPVITSAAVETGLEKTGYQYQVTASDANPNDTLSYGLEISDNAMSINKQTGLINWQANSGLVEPLISDNGLCEAPPISLDNALTPKEKWYWQGAGKVNPSSTQVMHTPLVVPLFDTNANGIIDTGDERAIVFQTYINKEYTKNGMLRAINAKDGSVLWDITNTAYEVMAGGSIAAGDIDNDGFIEIIAPAESGGLIAFEHDGTFKWKTISNTKVWYGGASIADLDKDGVPEIIVGNVVFNNNGDVLWSGSGSYGTNRLATENSSYNYGPLSFAADIDLDGFQEVIAGGAVYSYDGSLRFDLGEGFAAVANFDNNDFAEIVRVYAGRVSLVSHTGEVIWNVPVPGEGRVGAPTVADLTGDGIPEIGVAGRNYYVVFNSKGNVLWSKKIKDYSSNFTGSSVFDFNGDGRAEVVYADEDYLRIYDGPTGNVVYKIANSSATTYELPVIADIDNDGHAEIVLAANNAHFGYQAGIRVFEDVNDNWAPTRAIWNQHAYNINNVDENGGIPTDPQPSWLTHNTFRLNTFLDRPALAQADLVVHSIRYDASAGLISAIVKNRGLASSSATSVDFFHEHGRTGDTELGSTTVEAIEAGQEIEISISTTVDDAVIIEMIRGDINTDEIATECNYKNNSSYASITEVRVYDEGKLWDKQKFAVSIKNENDAPVITNLNSSGGSEGSEYSFQVTVEDPDLGDAFTYQLDSITGEFTINAKTGEVKGTGLTVGSYDYTIIITDLAGLSAEQRHSVVVGAPSNNPPKYLTHPDLLVVDVGTELTAQVQATDPEGDEITYVLASSPQGMTIDSTSGFLRWLPGQEDLGQSWIYITAYDNKGASSTTHFQITVEDPYAGNLAPSIVSVPRGTIYAGKLFEYQVIAEDDQPLNELNFELENKIAGMAITADGLFTWLPTSVQAGQTFNIVVHVNDGRNGKAAQSLNLPVNHSANHAPVIISRPANSVIQDTLYEYLIKAEDKDGDAWTATLLEGPNGLTLEGTKLVWTPSSKQTAMQHAVKIQVEDNRGAISTQSFTVWVNTPAINNDAPTILSAPTSPAMVGSVYQYQMVVSDPENDPITYQLSQSATGMTINKQGLLTWSPSVEQIGESEVVIALSDGVNNLTHSFTLVAVAPSDPSNPNNYPVINSLPNTQASTLNSYSYQVDATDANGDVLTYSLTKSPTGMNIDANGLVTWQATAEQIMAHAVKVSVSDGQGSSVQSFNITVSDTAVALEVSIVFTPAIINQGDSLTATIYEQGGSGKAVITATLDGKPVSLTANNKLAINDASTGSHTVSITVTKGENTVTESATFYVQDGSDTTPPVVSISAPKSETNISAPTPLIGSVTDSNLKDYQVMMSPKGKQQWTEIATGNSEVVDGQIAMIDPTLLMNGFYDVVVLATDVNGAQAQDGITINVEGNLKIGNFSFTVTDLEVPLAGIPIQVTRTYDSRRRFEDLDFSYGWSIGYKDIKLEESRPLSKGWSLKEYRSGFMGTTVDWCVEAQGTPTVSVTLPNGHQERFAVEASPKCSAYVPAIDVKVTFKPLNNAQSKLALKHSPLLRLNANELINLGTFVEFDPEEYILTTKEGFVYHINQTTGIDKVNDPYGNTLTYTDNGIFHSGGQSIQFKRNAKGRIEKLIDPNGKEFVYQYDENEDLEKAINFEQESTRYTYEGQHAVKDIFDPLNRRLLTNHYDDAGRLFKQVDADGIETLFDHDVAGRQSTITDRRGNTTTYYYDDNGNVTNQFDAYNQETAFEYWPNNEKMFERKFDKSDSLVSEIYYEVDQATRDITKINDNGRITTYVYQPSADGSKTETITDPELKVYVNHYDPVGNIYKIDFPADASGEVKTAGSKINNKGQVEWTLNSEQEKTSFTYYSGGKDDGRKKTEKDADNNVTTFTYDANGNVASRSNVVTINEASVTVLNQYFYDDQNRLTKTIHPDQLATQIFYDAAGNVDYELDKLNRKTDYDYNLYGKLEEVIYPDSTRESKTYDAEGNLETETDRQNRTTRYEYDKLNRLTITRYFDETYTEVKYDALGNVEAEWDEKRNKTLFKYDSSGRLEYTQDEKGNRHQYGYDDNNNLKTETDKNHKTTTYTYNALGQKTATELADNKWLKQSFDTLGRKLTSTDQENKVTKYGYNKLGQLETVTQSLQGRDLITRYSFDEMGNKLTQEDALNRVTTWTYNILGQVKTRTLPELMSESFVYDDLGNMETHTDFNNKVTTYAYHPLNDRLERVDYADGNFELYSYYDAGQVKSITTTAGIVKYEYDRRDRLTLETKANGDSIAYDYDDVGNRTEVTTTVNGTSTTTTYVYNVLNQLEQVKEGGVVITTYTYDNAGNLKTTTAENELVTTYNYDAVNRLDDMAITDKVGTVVESYDYVLRDSGRRSQVIEANGRTVDYGYDDLYRLTTESVIDAVNGAYSATYTYDDVGNRKTSDVDGVSTAFDYDDNDRLLTAGNATYSYDDQGNQLTITDGANVTKQSYDDLNKLISSQVNSEPVISFSYDARGIRVSRTHNGITTQYLVDHNRDYAQVLAETNNGQLDTSYIYGHDLIKQARAGNNSFYLTDGIGSTRLLSDDAGVVTDSYNYAAFGELLNQTGETENNYRYTGEQYDAGLDNYYLRARYYDQGVGRFTQQDEFEGWDNSPITLNKYVYGNSDPVIFTDPSGHFGLSNISAAISIAGRLAVTSTRVVGTSALRFAQSISRLNNKIVVAGRTVVVRVQYMKRVKELKRLANTMRKNGKSSEEIAKVLNKKRRALGRLFKHVTDAKTREHIFARNMKKYGDKWGPTWEHLRRNGKSWDDIIESSSRANSSLQELIKIFFGK